ncbi:MAG: hypothetical protein M1821_008760 [Bathelium mastoideum]|nr:MAG: hypothetical protein M1821_008760 [Bathelium mastoideum]
MANDDNPRRNGRTHIPGLDLHNAEQDAIASAVPPPAAAAGAQEEEHADAATGAQEEEHASDHGENDDDAYRAAIERIMAHATHEHAGDDAYEFMVGHILGRNMHDNAADDAIPGAENDTGKAEDKDDEEIAEESIDKDMVENAGDNEIAEDLSDYDLEEGEFQEDFDEEYGTQGDESAPAQSITGSSQRSRAIAKDRFEDIIADVEINFNLALTEQDIGSQAEHELFTRIVGEEHVGSLITNDDDDDGNTGGGPNNQMNPADLDAVIEHYPIDPSVGQRHTGPIKKLGRIVAIIRSSRVITVNSAEEQHGIIFNLDTIVCRADHTIIGTISEIASPQIPLYAVGFKDVGTLDNFHFTIGEEIYYSMDSAEKEGEFMTSESNDPSAPTHVPGDDQDATSSVFSDDGKELDHIRAKAQRDMEARQQAQVQAQQNAWHQQQQQQQQQFQAPFNFGPPPAAGQRGGRGRGRGRGRGGGGRYHHQRAAAGFGPAGAPHGSIPPPPPPPAGGNPTPPPPPPADQQ